MKSRFVPCFVAALVATLAAVASSEDKKPVKVFLLVGQSNMQGKGSADHLKQLVESQPVAAAPGQLLGLLFERLVGYLQLDVTRGQSFAARS